MADEDTRETIRRGATRSEERRRLHSEKMRGSEVWAARTGGIRRQAVIGVVRDQRTGSISRALTNEQVSTLSLISGP